MSEAEVQPLVAFILRCPDVVVLLIHSHLVPDTVPRLVPPHEVTLDEDRHHDIPCNKSQKDLVSAAIQWLVVVTVNLRCNDGAGLADHVVQGTADCTRAHRTGVTRNETDYDGR